MKYQWILFDADETLFHFDAFSGLKHLFNQYDVTFSAQDYNEYQQTNKRLWDEYQNHTIDAAQLQHTRFKIWADKLGVDTQVLNSGFLNSMAEICALLPGAGELLSSLSGKVKMGIITNGFTDLQQIRLQRTGLNKMFEHIVISEQVGVAKPHINIFEHAFKLMQHPEKDQILMVGDNPHSDIKGANNAGIHSCWFNHRQEPMPEGIKPHYQVTSLAELQQLLHAPTR
ncbi:pyrimidine 5'-nucleotidase [Flocculibacter collagenilyticus]|uniref:pyrimidine 5'-nucleotidase n=1 Tax=Flocculibacter collagenilyticus TaxID=2744479 RepID=UPI0018F50702|nr:pyrimidine 5'-nucleotidase [Flocculibacter collagenilyticus]